MNYADFERDGGRRWGGWLLVGALHVGVAALLLGQKMMVSKPPQDPPKPQPVDLTVKATPFPLPVEDLVIRTEPQPPLGKADTPPREGPPLVGGEPGLVTGATGGTGATGATLPAKAMSIALACPQQVAPEMPARATQKGVSGSVRALLTVREGRVMQVEILSAQPRGYFEAAVRSAVAQYRCVQQGSQAVVAEQVFEFTPAD
jgi:protein TonB